ncbi:MAG: flagellar hook assembly protein FlgD, partial [Fibrobacterota bacterium]
MEIGNSVSQSVSDISKKKEVNKVSASIDGTSLDAGSSKIKKEYEGELFEMDQELGKNDFLELLVTQLRYQDPLKPMDNQQFVAQMAQFSALEGTQNLEKAVGELNKNFNESIELQNMNSMSISNSSSTSLIGKNVRAALGRINVDSSESGEAEIAFHSGGSRNSYLTVRDESGDIVRDIALSDIITENRNPAGDYSVIWDGKNNDGQPVGKGVYNISITDSKGDPDSNSYTFIEDKVLGVNFTSNGATVTVNGQDLPVANVLSVAESSQQTETAENPFINL